MKIAAAILLLSFSVAYGDAVDFESDRWELKNAKVTTYLERPALMGAARVRDVEFGNGVIEVDVAVTGNRSYPGIDFRMQGEDEGERFYLRPHRAGLYPDALQYAPLFNGTCCWQLYSGEGFTAASEIPEGRWIHVKIEVSGSQARVFLDHSETPALVIPELLHGASRGGIGLHAPADGSAFFSEFRYIEDNGLEFEELGEKETPEGMITDWEISRAYPAKRIDMENYPSFFVILYSQWREAACDPSGLLNLSRHAKSSYKEPGCIFARTVFQAHEKKRMKMAFGYSDAVSLFHNGKIIYTGNCAYRSRDPSFVGVVGLFDQVHLDVEKGLNEIFFMTVDSFGGWGLKAWTDETLEGPRRAHDRTEKVWETEQTFLTPESVVHDAAREILYVTSFDVQYAQKTEPSGYISKVKLNGEIEKLKWVEKLKGPCGMALFGDKLYVAERGVLAEIDIPSGKVMNRYPVPESTFINDVAVDAQGRIYMSDSFPPEPGDTRAVIHRFVDGKVEPWIRTGEISRANGLFVHDEVLLVGCTGDCTLKSVGLEDRRITTIASLGAGVVDGIRVLNNGNYLVSLWQGQAYAITPDGGMTEVLNTFSSMRNIADFEYIKARNLLVVPTFVDNRVAAYVLDEG